MDTEDLLTGRTLENRYALGPRLGGGRAGGVYRAVDLRGEREVAVRVIAAGGLGAEVRSRLRAAFRSEARTAVRVSHPNLVQTLDYGSDEGLEIHYLVTELLEPLYLGGFLREFGPPPLPGAVALVLQAAHGLGAAHAAGLVHRGMRPASLLLGDGGGGAAMVRVVDFARVDLDVAGSAAEAGGGYAAPELRQGERCTPASDVYALAVTALEVLTARTPIAGAGAPRLLLDAARALPTPPPVLDVLVTALSPDPRERHRDARDFADALEAAVAAAGIVATAPRLKPRRAARRTDAGAAAASAPQPAPAAARGRPVALAAALALVVLGGVMAVMLAGVDEPVEDVAPSALAGSEVLRTIAPGQTVTGRFTSAEPAVDDRSHYHFWRLDASPGERVIVTMRSGDVDSYLAWGVVTAAGWEERGTDDDGGGGHDARLVLTVPATGEYGIRAYTYGRRERGSYTLSAAPARAPEPIPMRVGETLRGVLSEDDAVEEDGSFYDLYLVSGAPGERIVIDMRSSEFDAYLTGGRLVGAAVEPQHRDDDGGAGTDARLEVALDADGRYAVMANSYSGGMTGAYTLSVRPRD
jgi:hypothetical protein